jgi:DNA-directed RNA polymerase subunit beta'
MGHLIPAGTGLPPFKRLRIPLPFGEELTGTEETLPADATTA